MVVETTTYARVRDDEVHGWLHMLDYYEVVWETEALQWEEWDYLPTMGNAGGSETHVENMTRHPCP